MSWLAPGVRRVPAREAVLVDVGGDPGRAVRRLDAVELALVDRRVAGRRDDGGGVLERRRQLDLRVLRRRHVRLERVLDAVLGGEVARHQRRARGRAHARVRERVRERQAVPLQARQPGHVALRPAGREVLDRALLVGQEEQHVHARDATRRRRPPPSRPFARGGRRGRRGLPAEQDPGCRGRGTLQQLSARDPVPLGVVGSGHPWSPSVGLSTRLWGTGRRRHA